MSDIYAAPATVLLSVGRTLDQRVRWATRLFGLGVRHVVAPDMGNSPRAEHVAMRHGAGQTWRVSRIAFDLHPTMVLTDLPILWWFANNSAAFWSASLRAVGAGSNTASMVVQALCGQDVPPAALWLCESDGTQYPAVGAVLMTHATRLSLVPNDSDELNELTLRDLLTTVAVTF